jgi:hypothetical protein
MKPTPSDNATRWIVQSLWLGALGLMTIAYFGCGDSNIFGHGGNSNSQVSGTVVVATVSGSTVNPSGTVVPNALVWLEQVPPSGNVLNFIQSTTTGSNGQFQFNSVSSGTYELVTDVASMPSSSNPSNATITTTVTVGSSGGSTGLKIPLVAESGTAAAMQGVFTTSPVTNAGPLISYAGLQSFTIPGSSTGFAQIPFFSGGSSPPSTAIVTSSLGTNCTSTICPGGTLCACYLISLPASNPVVGAANSSGASYSVPSSGNITYSLFTGATINSSPDCSPSQTVNGPFTVGSGSTTTLPNIDFQNCS